MFDRQIRDAAARIEHVRTRKGFGRTDVETGMTGAAMIHLRLVGQKRQVGEDRAQKEPGAELRETRLLCLPAQPSPPPAQAAFHHRRGVDENLKLGSLGSPRATNQAF